MHRVVLLCPAVSGPSIDFKGSGQWKRSFGINTLPQLSSRPPPSGGWINDDNQKDLCDKCINNEARRCPPAQLPDGSVAPCRLCRRIPECPGYILDENSVLANVRPKMVKVVGESKSTKMELQVPFENWPALPFDSFMRRMSRIAVGAETTPLWDRFPHRALVCDTTSYTSTGCKARKRVFCFPTQAPLDHLSSFHLSKGTQSRVGYKSLILFSTGDAIVAFGPLVIEHTCTFENSDESSPSTKGKVRFSAIYIPHSSAPIPILEAEMYLISVDNAKSDKYVNLPPFDDFEKYARHKIGALIMNANSEFRSQESKIQFQPETLRAARAWMLETPNYVNHIFWNHRRLTQARCGKVTTDWEQHKQDEAAKSKAEKKRARDEKAKKERQAKKERRIYKKSTQKGCN